jgi:segregation and condensation protein A
MTATGVVPEHRVAPEAAATDDSLPFVVELDAFSGPLDLLLHLLREEQIDIADIPIARIADQFLRVIHDLGLNQAADYLDMASRLVRLKAQMLMPRHSEEDGWEDPRAELVRRLLEYQQVKEIALWLSSAADRRALRFPRGYLPAPPELPPPPQTLDLGELLLAVDRVLAGIITPVLHRVVVRPLDVEDATARRTLTAPPAALSSRRRATSRPTATRPARWRSGDSPCRSVGGLRRSLRARRRGRTRPGARGQRPRGAAGSRSGRVVR